MLKTPLFQFTLSVYKRVLNKIYTKYKQNLNFYFKLINQVFYLNKV